MTMQADPIHGEVSEAAVGEFADKLFGDLLGAMATYSVTVGYRKARIRE